MTDKRPDIQSLVREKVSFPLQEKIRRFPAAPVLAAVLSVACPAVFVPGETLIPMLLPVLLTAAGWYILGIRTALFQLALPAFLSLLSLFFHLNFRQTNSLSRLLHSRISTGIEAEIRICDPSLYHDGSNVTSNRRLLCRMTNIRFSPSDSRLPVNAPLIAVFRPETGRLSYGDIFRVAGTLQRPEPPLLPDSFDYGAYLRRRGIHFILQIDKAVKTGTAPSLYRDLILLRNRLLNALTAGLKTQEERNLAAALLFGCRQEVSRESRNAFIRSGTIHILTVSGLHIGMFAGAVFLLFLPLPFRWRMLLTPVVTLGYAFATGMQMPAVRAVLMLFCWSIPRAFMLRGSGLNAVFLAASLLLLWNPFQLQDAGFQYSFLCVFFLIATSAQTSSWLQLAMEKRHWIPDKKQNRWKRKIISGFIGTVSAAAGCLTAWLCSFGLTVYYQGIAAPFAMPANLLILPAVYLTFLLFVSAAFPCLIFPVLGKYFAVLLSLPLGVISTVSRVFGNLCDGRVPQPPVWSVLCGIAAFLLLTAFPGRKTGVIGLTATAGLLFLWCSGIFHPGEPELLLLYGGKQKIPAIVISSPENNFSLAANLADYRNAAAAADYLKQRGHAELDILVSSGCRGEFTRGAQYLPGMMKVGRYLAEKPSHRAKTAASALRKAKEHNVKLEIQPGRHLKWISCGQKIETFSEIGGFSFDIWKNEHKLLIHMIPDENAGVAVRISGSNRVLNLPRERQSTAIRMKLNW